MSERTTTWATWLLCAMSAGCAGDAWAQQPPGLYGGGVAAPGAGMGTGMGTGMGRGGFSRRVGPAYATFENITAVGPMRPWEPHPSLDRIAARVHRCLAEAHVRASIDVQVRFELGDDVHAHGLEVDTSQRLVRRCLVVEFAREVFQPSVPPTRFNAWFQLGSQRVPPRRRPR